MQETAFPEAAERVTPMFFVEGGESEPLLRWVTGLERPIAYRLDEPGRSVVLGTGALSGIGLTRNGLHLRALDHLRRTVPPSFAPRHAPAVLDDGAAALLVLPELIPEDEAWIAYPAEDGTLVVMREAAESTRAELERLRADRGDSPLFERPVRVRDRGFEPADWPAPTERAQHAQPGHDEPRARGHATVQGDAFADLADRIRAAKGDGPASDPASDSGSDEGDEGGER